MKKTSWKLAKILQTTTICLFLIFIFTSLASAQSDTVNINPEEIFTQANLFYQKADYEQAADLYQQLVNSGYESGNLYYNLGNAYFKLYKKGLAILYYEKAKRLIPTDPNLQTNLTYALTDVNEGEPDWGAEFLRNLANFVPLDLLTIISSGLFFLLIILISFLKLFSKSFKKKETGKYQTGWKVTLFVTGSLFIIALFFTTITYLDHQQSQAVLVKEEAKIYVEPNPAAGITYNLSEGARVYVLETKNDWCLIKRRDGKRGWIEQKFLEKI